MGAATIIAGVTAVAGAGKAISGAKQKRDAKRAARRFKRQKLKNVQEGRRISTLGADLAVEEQARATASTVDALSSGGVRGVVGGAANVVGANNRNARAIGAGLDQQQLEIDRAIAADNARIQSIQENRDNQELQNIQSQVNAGNQQMWDGFGDIAAGIGGIASSTSKSASNSGANSARNASSTNLNDTFKVTNPVFTGSPINPLTGKPYGV